MNNKELVKFLSSRGIHTDLISKTKIAYRPYVCPFEEILNLIGKKKSVFDIGCGSGMLLSLIAEFQEPTKVGGLEVSKSLVENTRILLKGYSIPQFITLQNGKSFPDEISEYEYITMIDVLHHVPYIEQMDFLNKLLLKMKPGSRLVFKDINASSPLVYFNKLHDLIFARQLVHERPYYEIKAYFKKNGYKIEKDFRKTMLYFPHYLIMIKK